MAIAPSRVELIHERDFLDINNPLIAILALMGASLTACAVLFVVMKSTAVVTKPTYRLGGAAAAFFLIFPMVWYAYTNSAPRESTSKALRVPSGFQEIALRDAQLAIAIPKSLQTHNANINTNVQ